MGKNVNVPVELLQRLVGFVGKSASLLEQVEKDGQLAKAAAPAAVELLCKQGLIDEQAKAAAVEALSGSHAKAVETLRRTATHVSPASMGAPADGMDKAASDSGNGLSEADRAFNAALGF
jgi:hypothetical protein